MSVLLQKGDLFRLGIIPGGQVDEIHAGRYIVTAETNLVPALVEFGTGDGFHYPALDVEQFQADHSFHRKRESSYSTAFT